MEINYFKKKCKKKDLNWYYNLDTRKDIFENGMESNLKEFSYSPIELYFLLKEINNHEPALVDIIISFICIKDSIYFWAKFYYNITLSKEDIVLIKFIYPVINDKIDNSISNVDTYLNNKKYSSLFQTLVKNMEIKIVNRKTKYNYFKYPKDLIRTISLLNIIKNNISIVSCRLNYTTLYDQTKDHLYRTQILPLHHLQKSKENIEKCEYVYKIYINTIRKTLKLCYMLGD